MTAFEEQLVVWHGSQQEVGAQETGAGAAQMGAMNNGAEHGDAHAIGAE